MVAKKSGFWMLMETVKRFLGIKPKQDQTVPFPQASTAWSFDLNEIRNTHPTHDRHDSLRVLAFLAKENGAVAESDNKVWDTTDNGYEQEKLAFEAVITQTTKSSYPAQLTL